MMKELLIYVHKRNASFYMHKQLIFVQKRDMTFSIQELLVYDHKKDVTFSMQELLVYIFYVHKRNASFVLDLNQYTRRRRVYSRTLRISINRTT